MKNYFTRLSNGLILWTNNPFWKDNCLAVFARGYNKDINFTILSQMEFILLNAFIFQLNEGTDNKQHYEIQSPYFGYEAFTLYTVACYYRSHDIDGTCIDKDAGLKVLSLFLMKQFMNKTLHFHVI